MPRRHAPRHGSLGYSPRKRAKSPRARIRNWPEYEGKEPTLLGFIGYKAGMTHIFVQEARDYSPWAGQEIMRAITILDIPPIIIAGIRGYKLTNYGFKSLGECWTSELKPDLNRLLTLPEETDGEKSLKQFEENVLPNVDVLRVFAHTQPRLVGGVPQKKPDLAEIGLGYNSIEEGFEFAKELLGKEVHARDVFKEGQQIDVLSITKGKGFQGPIKRWGIKKLQHKSRKAVRAVGCIGPWTPARVMWTVPRAGQMGFHQRTDYNKVILKLGEKGGEITPSGGFVRYGLVKGEYIMVDGSIPCPPKRLVLIRYAIRPKKIEIKPNITYISVESKQGD